MILDRVVSIDVNPEPLRLKELPVSKPSHEDLPMRFSACVVCHTELDKIQGILSPSLLPMQRLRLCCVPEQ